MFEEEKKKGAEIFGLRSVTQAVLAHILFFALVWLLALPLREKTTVVPIDLTLVVHENLDGNENEPPPEKPPEPPKPKPEPPKPKPKPEPPKPKPEPPKPAPVAESRAKAVETVSAKTNAPPKVAKKTPKETREERLARMRNKAKDIARDERPVPRPATNGRTGPKTLSEEEIKRRLGQGYTAGRVESLAPDERSRCISLIRAAFYRRWERPPWTDTLRPAKLRVEFGSGGRVKRFSLASGTGDRAADQSVLRAAQSVTSVHGLSAGFLKDVGYTVTVEFIVKPNDG